MISRRSFIKTGGLLGSTTLLGGTLLSGVSTRSQPTGGNHFAVAQGTDHFENTIKAVNAMGGMKKYVSEGDKVGILINAKFDYEGAFVEPLVALAVISECYEAGAQSVTILQVVPEDYWDRVPEPEKFTGLTSKLDYVPSNDFPAKFNDEDFVKLENIENTSLLKEAEMVRKAFECDRMISIAVAKHHAGTLYTGLIKNMMGLFTRATNVNMHLGEGKENNPERLAECLADINTIMHPDLYVLDATRFITSNGPVGPGEVKTMNYVAAGTDPVAMDVYGAEWNGHYPDDILMIRRAYEKGIGEMDKSKINVQWIG